MAQPKMSMALAFEVAMVDAINVFLREELHPRGLITTEGMDALESEEVLAAKYRVAREWAAKWAAFDGYDREPVPKQRNAEPGAARDRG